MPSDRPHTTHRPTPGHILFKSSPPPRRNRFDPTKMTTQASGDRAEALQGPAVAGMGTGTRWNRLRMHTDTSATGSPPSKKNKKSSSAL